MKSFTLEEYHFIFEYVKTVKFIKVPHLKIFPGGHFTEKLCADDDRTNL